jgi:hypothetical protein
VWQQFRVRYPTGRLITELITIHDGLFVVRAILQVDDHIVATGLAAALTVEEAEDRARTRVLSMLDLSSDAPPPLSSPLAHPTLVSRPSVGNTPVQVHSRSLSSEVLGKDAMPPMESPAFSSMSNNDSESAGFVAEENELMVANDRSNGLADLSVPTDDSDLMIKTTVEIRRLRWTNEQGRQHLENTYGKRSRQHLTREELLDFLQYLETQPTP